MRIAVIGGGPAGLYFSILYKKDRPDAQIDIYERNPEGVTWGWGVVFSEATMGNFKDADPESYERISARFARWEEIDVFFKERKITSGGHDFAGLYRVVLLDILTARARELGVDVHFDEDIDFGDDDTVARFRDVDLLVAADGINSSIRRRYADRFEPRTDMGDAKFIWLGSDKKWDTFTFIIRRNDDGLFQVHAYQFNEDLSTFIVECDEQSWRNAGLDEASEAQSIAYCEKLFAPELGEARLRGNRSTWINFSRIKNERWSFHDPSGEGPRNVVIVGDAAHTAHFSIGSGTKLAMEDGIVLVDALTDPEVSDDIPKGLELYWDRRWLDVAKLQRAAVVSRNWFEEIERYEQFEPEQLTASLLTRSKRITHGNLRLRDPEYVANLDRWFAARAGVDVPAGEAAPPPMFTPFRLRGMELQNRVVVSPMCMYSADDGTPNDWHLVHLGSRAVGGAGLVLAEMTDVSREARITPGCAGLYKAEHATAWKRIVDFVHTHSQAKIGVQLGHAGRKGSTKLMWEGIDRPLEEGNWEILAPSAIPYAAENQVPRAMERRDMDAVKADFERATRFALEANFDMLEVHMAHGYLLGTFISPLSNRREDEYGGSLQNRMRFPLEILDAVRSIWPDDRPISVRISATDWHPDGVSADESVDMAKMLAAHGCDLIDVSGGGTVHDEAPIYGRMFLTPFSDRIRNEAGIPTMAVGNIQGWDHVNTIIVSGRADLCALAKPHLYDPYLARHAAAEQGFEDLTPWPDQYRPARFVGERIATEKRAAEEG